MKTKHLSFIVLLVCLTIGIATGTVVAQTPYLWKAATSGGYTYKYVTNDPTHSRFYVLKNGLTVILSSTPKAPRIQCFVAVKAGSKTDPSTHTGLAHYLEHMMFKGTDKYGSLDWAQEKPLLDQVDNLYEQYNSTTDTAKRRKIYEQIDATSGKAAKFAIANEYDKMMTSMGGQYTNAFTSFEQTVYTDDIPASAVDKYLAVQSERFRAPVLRLFHTELEAVYEEKNRGLDNDGEKVFEALFAGMFPKNKYGTQTTIGTIQHLKNPSLKEIRKYFYTYYVPNNMGVIMSGDFDPDVMVKKVDEKFGYMENKPTPVYQSVVEKPITAPVRRDVYGPDPETLTIGFRFPGASTRDAQMLNLVGDMLTNGKAGLFDLDLVKKQKMLNASAFSYTLKDYSTLWLQGDPTERQSLEQVRKLMLLEIAKLKTGEFNSDLIAAIANNRKRSKIEANEVYSSRADNLMNDFTSGIDWRTDVANIADMAKITKAQIMAFAAKYLGDKNYVVVYKHIGTDKNIIKVDKPHITGVEVNREAQSPFLKMVNDIPATSVEPKWLDFNTDIQKAKVGPVDMLAVQNNDNSLFRLYYRYDMGNRNNKLLGVAASYLQYLGTAKTNATNVSRGFYKLASSFDINASGEFVTVSISGLEENFSKTIALYEDLVNNCKPDEKALAGLKLILKKSRANDKLDKGNIMQGLISYATYGSKNPFNNVLSDGEIDAIKATDLVAVLHDLANYKHTILYYGPQAAPQAATTLAGLHQMPTAEFKPYPAGITFTKVDQTKNKVLFADFDMVQAEINWVLNGPVYDAAETPAVETFNSYFDGGMSGIVFQTIRESKALAYSTYSYYGVPAKKGDRYTLQAYVGTQADKLNESVKAMNELLTDLPESEKVLAAAKANMRKSISTERITEDNILFTYLYYNRLGVDFDIRKNTFYSIDKTSFADVKAFHDTELKNKPFTYCIVASDKKVSETDLKKYGDLTKLSLKEIFGY